jgi:hypothetical protein
MDTSILWLPSFAFVVTLADAGAGAGAFFCSSASLSLCARLIVLVAQIPVALLLETLASFVIDVAASAFATLD